MEARILVVVVVVFVFRVVVVDIKYASLSDWN